MIKAMGEKNQSGQRKWSLCYYSGGKCFKRRVWATNKADAQSILDEAKGVSPQRLTWSQGRQKYLDSKEGLINWRVLADAGRHIQNLIDIIGDKQIEQTTAEEIDRYLQLKTKESSPSTANNARAYLFAIARNLQARNLINSIPFAKVSARRQVKEPRQPVPSNQIGEYLDLDAFTKPIIKLLALTGMRAGAAVNIKESDISDRLKITEKGGIIRYLLLDDTLLKIIEEARQAKASAGFKSEYLFINSRGNRYTSITLLRRCRQIWRANGLKDIVLHSLRHTFATELARAGASVDQIMACLSHKSRQASLNYIHLQEDDTLTAGSMARKRILEGIKAKEAEDGTKIVALPA